MPEPTSWADYGLTGLVVVSMIWLVWKLLTDRADEDPPANPGGIPPALACHWDPQHFQRIQDIHGTVKAWDRKVAGGEFGCAWRGRDEVRDLLEAIRASRSANDRNAQATERLTRSVDSLVEEIRRNGRGPVDGT